jgi:hypothetical protein
MSACPACAQERCPHLPPQSTCASATAGSGEGSVGLSFIDLLYAVPVVYLAERLGDLDPAKVTLSGWASVAVALAAVTFGWVGHHANRKRLPAFVGKREETHFFLSSRFLQFVLEILIIAAYIALARIAFLPHHPDAKRPPELRQIQWLAAIFVLYLFWDLLDIWIAVRTYGDYDCPQRDEWVKRAKKGMCVTLAFTIVGLVTCGLVWTKHSMPHSIVAFDVFVLGALWAYRATQERVIRCVE